MKVRNGFVSNSSSSSFILRKLPEDITTPKQVFDFYGMDKGSNTFWIKTEDVLHHDVETEKFCKYIMKASRNLKEYQDEYLDTDFLNDYFINKNKEELLHYYDYCFRNGYGLEEVDRILEHPEDYFEINIDDTYLGGPGCAIGGSYITKNGIEINCH